jgi:hypothetical protein
MVNASVMQLQGGLGLCVASVEVTLFRWSTEFSDTVQVWQRAELLTGRVYDFGPRVTASVEGHTKVMIAAWLKANTKG